MSSFHIDIHGCPKAVYDSEIIAAHLIDEGFEFKESDEKRDYTIIFTCGFLKASREECDIAIEKALKEPEKNGKVIVAGCYSQLYYKELKKKYPEIYLFFGVNELSEIGNYIKKRENHISEKYEGEFDFKGKAILSGKYWDYLKISEGCSHSCSFCIIPKIRGKYRSRSLESLGAELEMLESIGIKEINIISQDSSYYGIDRGRQDLIKLLDFIERGFDFEWIRILYLNPMHLSDEIVGRIGEGRVLPYFDIPFQHSSSKILKKMKRGGSGDEFLKIIEKIRKLHKGAVIRSSLITGFPGESEKEFEELKDFVSNAKIDHLGVFSYSDEPLSESFKLPEKNGKELSEERREIIYEIQNSIFHEKLNNLLNKKFKAIYEFEDDDFAYFRLSFQAPEGIDGFAYTERENIDGKLPSILEVRLSEYDYKVNGFRVEIS